MDKIEKLIDDLKEREVAVGKERDRLDDIITDARALMEDCDEAIENLQSARDALSRLV